MALESRKVFIRMLITILGVLFLSLNLCYAQTAEEARISMGKMNIPYTEDAFLDAINNNDQMVVDLFLDAGMNPNYVISMGKWKDFSPLSVGAIKGTSKLLEDLISHGADVNLVLPQNYTPLKNAVYSNNIEAAKVLLSHGANLDIRNAKGQTAMDIALDNGNKDMIALLKSYEPNDSSLRLDSISPILTEEQTKHAIEVGKEAAKNKQDIVYTEIDTDKSYGGFLGADLKTAGRAYYISPFCVVANKALEATKRYDEVADETYNMLSRRLEMRFVFTMPADQFNWEELNNMTIVLLQNGQVFKPLDTKLSSPQVTTQNYIFAISVQTTIGLTATFEASGIDFKAPFEVKVISKASKELSFKFQNSQPDYNQTTTDEYKW